MKFKEFVENINKLLKDRPEVGEYDVIISKDDEGNGYNMVSGTPTVGHYDDDEEFVWERELNAVCVN